MKFEDIKGDYQITAPVEKVDIARILRENLRDGSKNYVMIVTKTQCMVFFTKKFAKRLDRLKLVATAEALDELEYGLFSGKNQSLIPGHQLRSIGFTHGLVIDIGMYKGLVDILDNVDHLEALQDNKRFDELKNADTIKIVAGK